MRQGDGPLLVVGEEPEGLVELRAVGGAVRVLVVVVIGAGVELEGADGEEGFVGGVAVGVGVEDGYELIQFVFGGWWDP